VRFARPKSHHSGEDNDQIANLRPLSVATMRHALTSGPNERDHGDIGTPLGVPNLGMSGTIPPMMLDRLTCDYSIQVL
jgi:hypothetical protein